MATECEHRTRSSGGRPFVQVFLQVLPDVFNRIQVALVAADLVRRAGAVNAGADEVGDAARLGRQQDDLVGDVDGFLDAVGDEDDGLVLFSQKIEKVLLELAAGLLVDGGKGLVHQQH